MSCISGIYIFVCICIYTQTHISQQLALDNQPIHQLASVTPGLSQCRQLYLQAWRFTSPLHLFRSLRLFAGCCSLKFTHVHTYSEQRVCPHRRWVERGHNKNKAQSNKFADQQVISTLQACFIPFSLFSNTFYSLIHLNPSLSLSLLLPLKIYHQKSLTSLQSA